MLYFQNPTHAGKAKLRSDEERLLHDLLCTYDKEVRPVDNNTEAVEVTFELKLIQVVVVVSKDSSLSLNVLHKGLPVGLNN